MKRIVLFVSVCLCAVFSAHSQVLQKDGDTYDPDTLRYQYHAQKVGINLDTTCNLKLYHTVYDWLGTPYRFGGSGKKGIDCSGFTGKLYESVYNYALARDSRSMFKYTQPVSKSQLKEGDLVFFKIYRGRISHVGVYLGNNKFVHASTTRGVIISDLNEDYYRRYYYKGGRVLKSN